MKLVKVQTATPPFSKIVELADNEALPLGATLATDAEAAVFNANKPQSEASGVLPEGGTIAPDGKHMPLPVESQPEQKGKLPDDFPCLAALHAAEPPINTYGQLLKFADDFTQIPGVGPAGAKQISEALA